ncbi:hypothetical protein FQN54_007548 [Arachnomyces sp. PD_36]|nr:hypothetical protein FQN54_007548 [Arachnomyces sp. PD_36]
MSASVSKDQHQIWTKDAYLISTDPTLIPIADLTKAFASEDAYWAVPLPEQDMREMLRNSLCFGLYERSQKPNGNGQDTPATTTSKSDSEPEPTLHFMGIARCVTDYSTFFYVTDVYVDPSSQGNGLGTWLLSCVVEVVDSMPYLRRSMLITADWKRSVPFYEKVLGMTVMDGRRTESEEGGEGLAVLTRIGKGHPRMQGGNSASGGPGLS